MIDTPYGTRCRTHVVHRMYHLYTRYCTGPMRRPGYRQTLLITLSHHAVSKLICVYHGALIVFHLQFWFLVGHFSYCGWVLVLKFMEMVGPRGISPLLFRYFCSRLKSCYNYCTWTSCLVSLEIMVPWWLGTRNIVHFAHFILSFCLNIIKILFK